MNKKSNLHIPDERRNLLKNRLSELIFEIIFYYNRLRLEQCLINYEYSANPKISRTKSYSPLNMLINDTDEPGMTKEDISGFNTKNTEDYSNFIDRFCEFFEIYGIRLLNYDTGDTFITVEDSEKYLELLIQLQEIDNKNAKYLIRATDIGMIQSKRFTYENVITKDLSQISVVDNREKKYFFFIPQIIDLHNRFDPTPPEENLYLRKRIMGYFDALEKGYLIDRIGLERYLSFNEVGQHSKLNYLSSEIVDSEYLSGWKIALSSVKVTTKLRGKSSKELIKLILKNLQACIEENPENTKEQTKGVKYHLNKKLEEIEEMDFVDSPIETGTGAPKQISPFDQIIDEIRYVDESEYKKLKKFVSKLKRKPLPF